MLAGQRSFFILVVMLLAPMAGAVDNQAVIEIDLLEDAASKWHAMEPLDTIQSPLKDVDYQIYTSAGVFDPLTEEIPKSRLDDSYD